MMTDPAVYDAGNGYQALQMALQGTFGVVVSDEQQQLVKTRLAALLKQRQINGIHKLADALQDSPDPELCNAVLRAITLSTDRWESPDGLFRLLDDYILEQFISPERKLCRIWVVGTSQGQLPYSVAMHIADYRIRHNLNTRVEIVASDISEESLERARKGVFENSALAGLPDAWRAQYMQSVGDGLEVNDDIKSMVRFETRSLVDDFTDLPHQNMIICLDVLIYFSVSMKTRILQMFSHLLDPAGILVTAENESVMPFTGTFERVEIDAGVFYRQRA